jgi:hypothetical protein
MCRTLGHRANLILCTTQRHTRAATGESPGNKAATRSPREYAEQATEQPCVAAAFAVVSNADSMFGDAIRTRCASAVRFRSQFVGPGSACLVILAPLCSLRKRLLFQQLRSCCIQKFLLLLHPDF